MRPKHWPGLCENITSLVIQTLSTDTTKNTTNGSVPCSDKRKIFQDYQPALGVGPRTSPAEQTRTHMVLSSTYSTHNHGHFYIISFSSSRARMTETQDAKHMACSNMHAASREIWSPHTTKIHSYTVVGIRTSKRPRQPKRPNILYSVSPMRTRRACPRPYHAHGFGGFAGPTTTSIVS
jgi:hypothetical protein